MFGEGPGFPEGLHEGFEVWCGVGGLGVQEVAVEGLGEAPCLGGVSERAGEARVKGKEEGGKHTIQRRLCQTL